MLATVYGKTMCPNCSNAKNVLTKNNIEINYISLDNDEERVKFYERAANEVGGIIRSVPQIWIDDKYIGGYNELLTYINDNKKITFEDDF